MTEQQAMQMALKACPFCSGEAEYQKDSVRSGYGEYERNETYHAIKCNKCGSSSKHIHQKHLIDFTKYIVRDFRENPILRAKVEDDYDAYCEQSKQLAIDAWNFRALEQQPADEPELTAESAYQRGYLDGMAKRPKALSDEQVHNLIDKERAKVFSNEQRVAYRVAKAIEAAHNIWD